MTVPDMSDSLRRQILQRLESLRSAGVEFLPRCDEDPVAAANETAANRDVSGSIAENPTALVQLQAQETPALKGHAERDPNNGPPVESRRQELIVLAKEVAQCKRCPELAARTQSVFGVGPLDSELCFVGEAPGADEDRQGEPFVGAAGQLLNKIIAAMGMKREEVYICNVLRCRPPGNRTPKKDEADHCREYLVGTLKLVRPKFICALGLCAAQTVLNTSSSLTRLRGKFHDYHGVPVICTYHPSFLLPHRQPEKKKDVWDDMKMLLAKMGREPPAAGKTTNEPA